MSLIEASRYLTLAAMAWALWLSRRAWRGSRLAPRAPLFGPARAVEPFFPALLALLAVSLFSSLAVPALVVLLGLFCLGDWTRFRPWLYQSTLLLLTLSYLDSGSGLAGLPAPHRLDLLLGRLAKNLPPPRRSLAASCFDSRVRLVEQFLAQSGER